MRLFTCSWDATHLKMSCSEKSWGGYTLRQKCCDRSSAIINFRDKKFPGKGAKTMQCVACQLKKTATRCDITGVKQKHVAKSSTKAMFYDRIFQGRRTFFRKPIPGYTRDSVFTVAATIFEHMLIWETFISPRWTESLWHTNNWYPQDLTPWGYSHVIWAGPYGKPWLPYVLISFDRYVPWYSVVMCL